ncbi:PD-(D/E)XK motif protein [Tardiphaga sp. 11_C7_N12_6]|uniref:PD-(D/E)XK motif protein n=1 Tax=Tardiphaga sp. 11_C7_N12_6 TaxID=3240789 RepID=UPI003F268684
MITIREELVEKWARVGVSDSTGREWRGMALSATAPVRLLAGVREPDNRIALLIEARLVEAPKELIRFSARGLSVSDQRRHEEDTFRLAIVLERLDSREVFEVLTTDIANVAMQASTGRDAINAVTRRLEAWQACLRSGRRGLSESEQTGLFGELTVLEMLGRIIGYPEAVLAWGGPLDHVHDFNANGISLEIKSVSGIGNQLSISTLNQLETEGLRQLLLVRVRLREDPLGITLSKLVSQAREMIAQSSSAAVDFDDRLLRVGFLQADSFLYDAVRFLPENVCAFDVRQGFPRLTNSTIPAGIIDGSYVLDERALSPFRRDMHYVEQIMGKMLGLPQ